MSIELVYIENSQMKNSLWISSVVCSGKPRPSVTWWKDYRLLDDSYFFDAEDNLVKNVLEIEALTRDDLLSVIVCQASNNNITVPSPVSVTLDLNCE